ncbi:MAG: AAA family ATPase [Minisyncoccia bacterium]
MELTKIELTGFKSFAKKTTFRIDSSVTGIVGPNGSGKSNVAEAFRFVLGEQSVKSMRGKTGSDLIFKGSKGLGQMSRAAVLLTFKNIPEDGAENSYKSFPEVVIGREIFADGTNEYSINGTKVRLKDIQELLAHSNIGTSHHHIISQGEADRVLHSSVKERKEMVQDALGLRIYEWRLKESDKKLASVLENMREAQISRREIAPHVQFLKKQIDKVQKGTELRSELAALYHSYFAQEEAYIHDLESKEPHTFENLKKELVHISEEIAKHSHKKEVEIPSDIIANIIRAEETVKKREEEKSAIVRSVITLETELRILERNIEKLQGQEKETGEVHTDGHVSKKEATEFASSVKEIHEKAVWRYEHKEFQELPALFNLLKARIYSFEEFLQSTSHTKSVQKVDTQELTNSITKIKGDLETATQNQTRIIADLEKALSAKKQAEDARTSYKEASLVDERRLFELERLQAELKGKLSLTELKITQLKERKERFEAELAEGAVLIGASIFNYKNTTLTPFDPHAQDEHRKKIERLKLRIEDIGVVNVDEVTKEYESVSGRDEFLANEINDLETSKEKLEQVMLELRNTLATQFETGLKTININFERFFKTMFGGGEAKLVLVEKEKRQRKADEEETLDDSEKETETGIDVTISLPHKKVKDIAMLSGGERALASIALLFALSQVNPPPFLILDETDAALDESNAKKYGAVLNELSAHSKLIVITHNRETMSRTHSLYGVTIDVDGSSRILSVKLDEANAYAK